MDFPPAHPPSSSTPALNDAPMLLLQSLQTRNVASDVAAEKQLVALLSIPLDTYDTVTVLSLKAYPDVMSLLSPVTRRVSAPACPCWVMVALQCQPAVQGIRWGAACGPACPLLAAGGL